MTYEGNFLTTRGVVPWRNIRQKTSYSNLSIPTLHPTAVCPLDFLSLYTCNFPSPICKFGRFYDHPRLGVETVDVLYSFATIDPGNRNLFLVKPLLHRTVQPMVGGGFPSLQSYCTHNCWIPCTYRPNFLRSQGSAKYQFMIARVSPGHEPLRSYQCCPLYVNCPLLHKYSVGQKCSCGGEIHWK